MNKKYRLPFQNMTYARWMNLLLVAAIFLNMTIIGFFIFTGTLCSNLAFDYCAYWSGGRIINENGVAEIYNFDRLKEYQSKIYPQAKNLPLAFKAIPLPYFPVFVLPFQVMSLLKLPLSFTVWSLINLIGWILYLRFFTLKIDGKPLSNKLLLISVLSLPVFVNFYEGQLNIWLGICGGEFIRAKLADKPFKAGLWLGGWLLKPQLLILLVPILMIKRSYKIVIGFIITTFAVLVLSLGLIRMEGFINLFNILRDSTGGGAASNPKVMMNWRMMGVNLARFINAGVGQSILILGSILTVLAVFWFLGRSKPKDDDNKIIAFLGILAATSVITWHAHVHMAIILIPPMIYLLLKGRLNNLLFFVWVFMPFLVHFISLLFTTMINLGSLPGRISNLFDYRMGGGLSLFIFNLLLIIWAIDHYNQKQEETYISNER